MTSTALKCSNKTATGRPCKRTATDEGLCRQHAVKAGVVAQPVRDAKPTPDVDCGCDSPRLWVDTGVGGADAEPCEELTPSSALFLASCLDCGGTYRKPWRRVGSSRV